MKKLHLYKIAIFILVLTVCFWAIACTIASGTQTVDSVKMPEKIVKETDEVAGYQNWTKINEKPQLMESVTAQACSDVRRSSIKDPHENKYINVYVNSIGVDEMLTRLRPKFPVGTVIVKEKLSLPESKNPELLTVMIKRNKDFNPNVGDWEFITLNGEATKITSKGKLQNCKTFHISYRENDYLSRIYLSTEQWKNLK
jgi:hypothetical protein